MSASAVARPRLRLLRRGAKRLRARSRLRTVNLRRTASALARPIPDPPAEPAGPRDAVPKRRTGRREPRCTSRSSATTPDGVTCTATGGSRCEESYGWWPRSVPLGLPQLVTGTTGVLNGMGLLGVPARGIAMPSTGRWPRTPFTRCRSRLCPTRKCVSAGASSRTATQAVGGGRGPCAATKKVAVPSGRGAAGCGLEEGLLHLASRGSGCSLLYRPRTAWWWLQDRLARVSSPARR